MLGEERRALIIKGLVSQSIPVSASLLAKQYGVSRQIIVGDVALLRAQGNKIVATSKGYILDHLKTKTMNYRGLLACQHTKKDMETELKTIIEWGGEILDVIVEHPLYGDLSGSLQIKTIQEVQQFMLNFQKDQTATMLADLTHGIHLHTIECKNEKIFKKIEDQLARQGILYRESE